MARSRVDPVRTRARGGVLLACFAEAVLSLTEPKLHSELGSSSPVTSLYPWWTWALAGVGAAAALVIVVTGSRTARIVAAAAALVIAMQVAGTGVVAYRQWRSALGTGGVPGDVADVDRLRRLALLIAVAGVLAAVIALRQLALDRAFQVVAPTTIDPLLLLVGCPVFLALPWALIVRGEGGTVDLTSWGAMGLMYAGPWGAAVVLAGWVRAVTSAALLTAVSACCLVALVGPQLVDLTGPERARLAVAFVVFVWLAGRSVASARRETAHRTSGRRVVDAMT